MFPFAPSEPRPWARPGLSQGLILSALLTAVGCSGDPTPEPTETPGTPTPEGGFTSAFSGSGGNPGDDDLEAGAPSEDGEAGGDEEREVEEADIVLQVEDALYVLNAYRGLQIYNVANPDAPTLVGRYALTGYPVEMYVRDGTAYVVVSDYYTYWPSISMAEGDAISTAESFRGSAIAAIDVSDPAAPRLLGRFNLEGYVSQTRAVGDVLYAVSVRYPDYACGATAPNTETQTYVTSVDISDPSAPVEVDTLSWPGTSAQIHATSTTLFVAEPVYDYGEGTDGEDEPGQGGSGSSEGSGGDSDASGSEDPAPPPDGETPKPDATPEPERTPGEETPPSDPIEPPTSYYKTKITLVDISDPHGVIHERGNATVDGYTWDKFALDAFDGTFRVVTQKWDGVTSGTLSVLDISNPDAPTVLSVLDLVLPVLETVTATRFDGDRAYVVTAERTDPLFVIDLVDPANPRMAGHVEMPGQLDHIIPQGDRLVAFGSDNSEEGTWKFAVSLFDVADMDAPALLDRENIGEGSYSWSAASWDDKSFSVLPELGLIALPFSAYSDDYTTYTGGVQLVDFDREVLTQRGMVTWPGYIMRVREVNDRLVSLSDTDLIVIDASDRDNPQVTASRTLARYVADYLPGEVNGVQLVTGGWYYYSDQQPPGALRVVSNDKADDVDDALAEIELGLQDGQLVDLGDDTVGLVRTEYDAEWMAHSTLDVYDLSDPAHPARLSTTVLPGPVWSWAYAYGWYWGSSGGALVQTGDTLAYLETSYYYYGGVEDTAEEPQPGGGKALAEGDEPLTKLHVIDVSDPNAPAVTTLPFDESLYGLWGEGDHLYATHVVESGTDEPYTARYYTDIIDVTDASAPVVNAPINVPGVAVHALDGGQTLLTLDYQWAVNPDGYEYMKASLNTVSLNGDRARLTGRVDLPGYVYTVLADGDAAYVMSQPFWWEQETSDEYCYYSYAMELLAVDLSDPADLRIANQQALPVSYGWPRALTGGHLFIDGYSGGLLVYDVANDPLAPTYQDFVRTSGWALHVRVQDDTAYLPAGMYGVGIAEL